MQATVKGGTAFGYLEVVLNPGEEIIAESDAMSSMDSALDMKATFNGGLFRGLARKYLGGESLFINHFSNPLDRAQRLTLVQTTPGEIRALELNNESICFQPGAFIACTPGLKLGVAWAGFASLIAREGLFKLLVQGTGTLWYGAYGALLEREVDGETIVDTSHLVSYEPQLKLKIQMAGGLFSSLFGGEGLVTRIEGKGKIMIQSRSMSGLVGWLNPKLF